MSITLIVERQSHSKGFTMIPNHIINDENLSLKAKGLIASLLSLRPDYDGLSIEHLAKIHQAGTTAIRSGVQELKDAGYLEIEQKYDARGHYSGYEWRLRDHSKRSKIPEFGTEIPNVENPRSDQPTSGIPRSTNTYTKQKLKKPNTTTSLANADGLPVPPLRLTAPMLTETREQVFKALEQVPLADQQRMLDELSAAIKAGTIKTTAVRWFHGVIKRYREGTYNFKPLAPQSLLERDPQTLPSTPQKAAQNGPPSVRANERSDLGKEYLSKLKRTRRSTNSSPAFELSNEGRLLGQDE